MSEFPKVVTNKAQLGMSEKKQCYSCYKNKKPEKFSARQWKRSGKKRVCRQCYAEKNGLCVCKHDCPNNYKVVEHECTCENDQDKCKAVEHKCTCENDQDKCKAIEHKCTWNMKHMKHKTCKASYFHCYCKCTCNDDPNTCKCKGNCKCTCHKNTETCKSIWNHKCTCHKNTETCKKIKAQLGMDHNCTCHKNPETCKKKMDHLCSCHKNPKTCKNESYDNNDYKKETCECTCYKNPKTCRKKNWHDHDCICNFNQEECQAVNHVCICKNNPLYCKASHKKHTCVCEKYSGMCFKCAKCNCGNNYSYGCWYCLRFSLSGFYGKTGERAKLYFEKIQNNKKKAMH